MGNVTKKFKQKWKYTRDMSRKPYLDRQRSAIDVGQMESGNGLVRG